MQSYQTKIFFSTKADGNLAFHVGDEKNGVVLRHKTLALKHHYDYEKLIYMKQIHSDIVHIIDKKDSFYNPPQCDALITNKRNTPIMVMVADCTPLILSDEINGIIAVVHAGRQGTFKNILKKTIHIMKNNFDCKVQNIKVAIGASICKNCYEVGKEIYQEVKELNLQYSIMNKSNSCYLDINKILLPQLKDLKIKTENITKSTECSVCNNDKYYSYRKCGRTGRFCGVIQLV